MQILPYMDEQELYNKFHLDEPWDSEHNRALIAQMPSGLCEPEPARWPVARQTTWPSSAKECVFDGTDKGVGLRQRHGRHGQTIAVVEADTDKAVEWTKPDDLHFDAKNPTAGLGHVRPGGWLAAFCDGHTEFISNSADPKLVKAMMTKAGGEGIQLP